MVAKRAGKHHRGSPPPTPEQATDSQGYPLLTSEADPSTANRLLLQAARRAPGWTIALVVAMLVDAVTSLLFPAALAVAVDAALQGEPPGMALVRLGALLAAGMLAEMLASVAGASYGASVVAWLRHRLFRHVLALGIAGQRRFAAGDVMTRLTGDAPGAAQVLGEVLDAVVTVTTTIGAVVALGLIDWRLAATFLASVPITFLFLRRFIHEASDLFVDYRRLQAAIATRLIDALRGIRTIRASGTATREIDRVLAPLPQLSAAGRSLWRAQREVTWQFGLLVPLLQIVVLAVAGFGVTAGRLTPGDLLAAVGYFTLALGLFEEIDSLLESVSARAGAARVAEVLAERPTHLPGALPLPDGPGAVTFRGVTVRAGETVVLDQLDLEVPAGAAVAIVGRSGAGKTTLAWMVGRLVDPDEGEVLLDGVPVSRLRESELRRAVSYAFERPALLGSTIEAAIAYGRPSASRAEVEQAAEAAQADGFVRRLPAGYATQPARVPLSGGEVQRLGLARAIAQGGRVLVLDDATSSLDTATEVQVEAALAALAAGRTSLVVAHRAAAAARADLVAWLDGGRIRALAPHVLLWDDPEYQAVFAGSTEARHQGALT